MKQLLILGLLCALLAGCAAPAASVVLPFAVLESDLLAFTPVGSATCDPCTGGATVFPVEGTLESGNFPRGIGKPTTEERNFDLAQDGDVCMVVTNNGCASTTITIDGLEVVSPDQFDPGVGEILTTNYLSAGPYQFAVTVASIPSCSVDVELRACDPTPPPPRCHDVAKDWCVDKDWSMELSFDGGIVCVAPGYTASDDCEGSGYWRLVVWKDGGGDPLCPYVPSYSTVEGNYYGGHDPCGCEDNLMEGGTWDMQDCIPDP